MHEVSVAISLYQACRREIDSRGGGRLHAVRVVVGELAGVDPESLALAWGPTVDGTGDHGATLEIDWRPAEQTCPKCGPVPDRQPGTWLRLCPFCSAPMGVRGAQELDITRIDFLESKTPAGLPA